MAALASVDGIRLTYLQGTKRAIRFVFKSKEKVYILVSQSQGTARSVKYRNTFWGRWYHPHQIVLKTLNEKPKALSVNYLSFVVYQTPPLIWDDIWEVSFWTTCKMCTAALFSVHITAQCGTAGFSLGIWSDSDNFLVSSVVLLTKNCGYLS